MLSDVEKLRAVKLVHTAVWVFLAGCVVAIPILALTENVTAATWVLGLVMLEVIVLAINGMRCPLTDIAARYTADRRPNFDIYLPEWLAENNKSIFGWLYVIGLVITAWRWSWSQNGDPEKNNLLHRIETLPNYAINPTPEL